MTPWHDCAPCHSQPDGSPSATDPPSGQLNIVANSRQLGPPRPLPATACRITPAMAARPPTSCQWGCPHAALIPIYFGIWLGPFAFPCPSSLVSTTRTSRFGGFGFTSDNTNRPTPGSAQASGRAAGTVIEPGIANIRHRMTYQHVSPSTANHIRLSHLRHAFCPISTMPPPQTGAGQPTSPITRQVLPVRPPQPRFRRRICYRPYPRPALRHRRQSPGR